MDATLGLCAALQRAAYAQDCAVDDAWQALSRGMWRAVLRDAALAGRHAFVREALPRAPLHAYDRALLLADVGVAAAINADAVLLRLALVEMRGPAGLVARVFAPWGGPLSVDDAGVLKTLGDAMGGDRAAKRARVGAAPLVDMDTEDVLALMDAADTRICDPSVADVRAAASSDACDLLRVLLAAPMYGGVDDEVLREICADSSNAVHAVVLQERGVGGGVRGTDKGALSNDEELLYEACLECDCVYDRTVVGGADAIADGVLRDASMAAFVALPGIAEAVLRRAVYGDATPEEAVLRAGPLAGALSGLVPAPAALCAAAHVLSHAGAAPADVLVAWARTLLGGYALEILVGAAIHAARPYYIRVLAHAGRDLGAVPLALVASAGVAGPEMLGALVEEMHAGTEVAAVGRRLDALVAARAHVSDADALAAYLYAVARYVSGAGLRLGEDQQAALLAHTAVQH